MAQVSNKKYDFDLLASLTENGWKIFTTFTVAANWLNVFAPVCVCMSMWIIWNRLSNCRRVEHVLHAFICRRVCVWVKSPIKPAFTSCLRTLHNFHRFIEFFSLFACFYYSFFSLLNLFIFSYCIRTFLLDTIHNLTNKSKLSILAHPFYFILLLLMPFLLLLVHVCVFHLQRAHAAAHRLPACKPLFIAAACEMLWTANFVMYLAYFS